MVKTGTRLFMKNVPGGLGQCAELLSAEGINIDTLAIHDASAYVRERF